MLKAFRMMLESCPELLLILVPRHPQRFDEVYRQCLAGGFSTRRRSSCVDNTVASAGLQILLGDSMGEMQLYYGAADIAFVGGSLVNTG
ncbi:MAG: 3-deoxy-D-manno-octulosonic acid transferase, partial [Pseudohongiellaceae bacterium]